MFGLSETGKFTGMFPAQRMEAGRAAAILKILIKDSNLALVFEAVQWH